MTANPLSTFLQDFRRSAMRNGAGSDGDLLRRFVGERDDGALAVLVRRHGPMVWGVCRRLLRSHHDAEDAFQATFLVLVQKAATVREQDLVGNFLYGVAHQTAVRMRALAAKRGVRERQLPEMPDPVAAEQDPGNDLKPVLDEELSHLPDNYRAVLVLCDLEGKTLKEAARQLAVAEGTVASRVARGRALLAKRLARRGVAVSGSLLAAILAHSSASAQVPSALVTSTIQVATLVAAGQGAAGALSPTVAAVMTGVMKTMFLGKIKCVAALLLAVGLLCGAGAGMMATAQQRDSAPGSEALALRTPVPGPKETPKTRAETDLETILKAKDFWPRVGAKIDHPGFKASAIRDLAGKSKDVVVRIRAHKLMADLGGNTRYSKDFRAGTSRGRRQRGIHLPGRQSDQQDRQALPTGDRLHPRDRFQEGGRCWWGVGPHRVRDGRHARQWA